MGIAAGCLQVPGHNGKGLGIPVLAFPQCFYCLYISSIGGQVKTAQALYRHNFAIFEQVYYWNIYLPAILIDQCSIRSANRAGIGLGMKTAMQRVLIFLLTLRAHGKRGHGSFSPVIWYIFNNGKAGTTISTVYKWVSVSAIRRISDFPFTIFTDGNIGRNHNLPVTQGFTFPYSKILETLRFYLFNRVVTYNGQGRSILHYTTGKFLQVFFFTLHLDKHPGGGIQDPTA